MKVGAIIGAQYGSEGKGVVAKHIANEWDVWVRTGGPNAGHSFVHEGRLYKMQQLPCGWVNEKAKLVLGAGAIINPRILQREIELVESFGFKITDRLWVDGNATVLTVAHENAEGHTHGEIHQRIGSTGEGVGAARRSRMNRGSEPHTTAAQEFFPHPDLGDCLADTQDLLHAWASEGLSVMLEGTQGAGLSLIHGPWPHTTSADTNAAQFCADAGLPPQWVSDVYLVARTHPIRVAGNSGPLAEERTWEDMSKMVGREVEERTTVTNKVRRIGAWDEGLFAKAVRLNDPTGVVLTFMDYMFPECHRVTKWKDFPARGRSFIEYIERTFEKKVALVGTGFSEQEGWYCVDRR